MELVSGFLLWIADIVGIRWIRQEQNNFKKVIKAITWLAGGIVLVMLFFVFWYR